MKVKLLKPEEVKLQLKPTEDIQYVFVGTGEHEFELFLQKEGIQVEFLSLFSLRGKEKLKLATKSIHKVPHTSCIVNVKGVLFDNSQSDYVGKIIIEKKAQQTTSYLEDNVLNMGDKTKNHTQPILEIEANDVKASHGATTGRISEDQIYYLMSRGLTREEAENTIIEGFFESTLSLIKDDKIRGEVKKVLDA